jgi:DNA polymerase-3 subunit chi
MPEATIYFVETQSRNKRDILCRWVERLYEAGKLARVAVDSTHAAQHIDQLLWTFSDTSFIPHRIASARDLPPNASKPPVEPVLVTMGEAPPRDAEEALVCDAPVSLEYMRQFSVAVHFIPMDDPDLRQQSRMLWQAAKDAGLHVQHIRQGAA